MPLPQGGILADEMGLGKTVEVLALILENGREMKFNLADYGRPHLNEMEITNSIVESIDHGMECCFCGKEIVHDVRHCFKCQLPMHFQCAGTLRKDIRKYFCPVCGTQEVFYRQFFLFV